MLGVARQDLSTGVALSILVVTVAVTARRRPHWILAAGVITKFTGGSDGYISTLGSWLLLLALATAILRQLETRLPLPRLGLPVWLLVWLAVRPALEGNVALASSFAIALIAVVTAQMARSTNLSLTIPLAWAGALFILYSTTFGVMDPTGLRFSGVSGNPNRMVAGVLLSLPFIVAAAVKMRLSLLTLALLGAAAEACRLVVRSGSSQGYVALLLFSIGALWIAVRHWPRTRLTLTYIGASGFILGTIYVLMGGVTLDDDTMSLSGRVPLYEAALGHISNNWLVGTGVSRFGVYDEVDRSTHSMLLSVVLIGGVGAGAMWLVLLVKRIRRIPVADGFERYAELSAIVFITLSITQNLEAYPLAWIILTNPSSRDLLGSPKERGQSATSTATRHRIRIG